MKYTLIARNGKVFTFFLKAVADSFQQAYGGVIITNDILIDNKSEIMYNSSIEQQGV